jgi:hypothetical protein
VRELPEFVQFSLLRFTYDLKADARKKNKASILFPYHSLFGQQMYDLVGVVVHQGASVSRPIHVQVFVVKNKSDRIAVQGSLYV